jgi:hypothetical protein
MEKTLHFEQREALKSVLKSRHFIKARKKSRFLEFICEQALVGNSDKINEYLIGVEVYERGTDFDSQTDPIVRVQAHEIRRSLKEYYETEGTNEIWRIELPPGHYVPQFIKTANNGGNPAAVTEPVVEKQTPTPGRASWSWEKSVIVGLSLLAVVLGFQLYEKNRTIRLADSGAAKSRSLPVQLAWFWQDFMPPAQPPLVTLPNHPLLRAAHDGDPPAVKAKAHLIPKEKLPEFLETVHYRELKSFSFVPTLTDFTGAGEAIGLLNIYEMFTKYGQEVRLKPSRLVDFEELRRSNAILLGGNQLWSNKVFQYKEGFQFEASVIKNPHPLPGEPPVFKPEFDPITQQLSRDYAIIMMMPNERKDQRILLLYGIYTQGSQAALEYVTNPDRLQELQKELLALAVDKKQTPPFFQVLIQTTVENHVPGKVSFVTARLIPR